MGITASDPFYGVLDSDWTKATPETRRAILNALLGVAPTTEPFASGEVWYDGTKYTLSAGVPPIITTQPQSQTVNVGEPVTFTIAADGSTSQQWRRNGDPIDGATATTYTIEAAAESDTGLSFDCVVTGPGGSVTSTAAILTVIVPVILPSDISGLGMWIAADDGVYADAGVTLAIDGQAVQQWEDKSGLGRHAIQATAGSRPLLKTNSLNGMPVLQFKYDGVDKFMRSTFGTALTQPNTIFIVLKKAAVAAAFHRYLDGITSTDRHLLGDDGATLQMFAGESLYAGTPDTDAHIFMMELNGASSALHMDGSEIGSGPAGAHGITGLTIGAAYTGTFGLHGDIAEVIVYDRVLTSLEITNVNNYLAGRYAIAVPSSGLVGAYESQSLTLADGSSVSFWVDESGEGNHITASGASRPTFLSDDGWGNPCVEFDGVDDFMTIGNPYGLGDEVTIVAVLIPGNTSRATILGQQNTAGAVNLELRPAAGLTRGVIVPGVTVGSASCPRAGGTGITEFLAYRRSGNTHNLQVNDEVVALAAPTASFTGNGIKEIGRRQAAEPSQYFEGKMNAIYIYNRYLSQVELNDLRTVLASRYQSHQFELANVTYEGPAAAVTTDRYEQGIVVNGADIFFSATDHIYRYSKSGGVYTTEEDFDVVPSRPAEATQVNGITFYDGKLWTGAANWPSETPRAWILEYSVGPIAFVAAHEIESGICEGGAWKDVGNGPEFWAIYHDRAVVGRYDPSFTLIAEYAMDTMESGLPVTGMSPSNNGFWSQGAAWLDDYFITPTHNGHASRGVNVYKWTGSGFLAIQRMQYPGFVGGQGLNFDGTPAVGADVLIAVRNLTNAIVRAQLITRGT